MKIEEISDNQIDLMLMILCTNPVFSVAKIPVDHKDYAAKGEHHAKVRADIQHLASLGFVEEFTNMTEAHRALNDRVERETGYKYEVYKITELGIKAFEAMSNEIEKEQKYRHSIN
jgi:hypothetical protein